MLSVKCKTPVNFEFSDGIQVTTITIAQDEESESLRAKLQRVLELEAGQGLPVRAPGAALAAAQTEFPPLFDAEGAEAKAAKVGWEALAEGDGAETLPEY